MSTRVDAHAIARGDLLLKEAIDDALYQHGEAAVAYFFSLVPAQGAKLWKKFKEFQTWNTPEYTFSDYVTWVVEEKEPMTRAFMPEGCKRPHREAFRPDMQKLIDRLEHVAPERFEGGVYRGKLAQHQIRDAFIEEVYFGRGETYQMIRRHHCVECPFQNCPHHL